MIRATTLALALLLLADVAPCGSCSSQRPVERETGTVEAEEAADDDKEAPSQGAKADPAPAK